MIRFALVFVAACGTAAGAPIAGTITIDVGGDLIAPTVGAAVPDNGNVFVLLGTRDIDCDTTLEDQLQRGVYLSFVIGPEAGAQTPFVSVIRVVPGGTHLNGSTGDVVIDALDGRVTGSLANFATTDADEGIEISASGTFDVAACF
jgi:hypothetical protein